MNTGIETLCRAWRESQDIVSKLDKVFVVGCGKSGTSWVMNVLNGHDEMVIMGEGCFVYQLVPLLSQAFGHFNEHQKGMAEVTRLRDVDLLLTARAIIDGQLARYLNESGCDISRLRVVGDKTPQHAVGIGALTQLYPECRIVHIIRDPRDVANSAWFRFGKDDPRPFEEYIRFWMTKVWPVNVGSARQAAPILGDRYLEVRYEDLHADETHHVQRMLEFLRVDASEQAVAQCIEAGSFKRRSGGRERGQADPNSPYRKGQVGDWQNNLPVDLIENCCQEIAPLMTACGYDPACAVATA